MEIFKPIVGFESHYVISNMGRVQNIVTGYFPKQCINANGYLMVYLKVKDYDKNRPIHRLIAEHFIPNPNNMPIVNHKNSDKLDNSPENLEWVSSRENYSHAELATGKKTSKYPGVSLNRKLMKFTTQGNVNGKNIYIGVYKTEELAFAAVKQFHKENGIINRYLSPDVITQTF